MRILRVSSAVVLGGISLILAVYGMWALRESFRPHYETPGIAFLIIGLLALVVAALFALPAATLVIRPRSVFWWIISAAACALAAPVLLSALIGSVAGAHLLVSVVGAIGLLSVAFFVRTLILALRQRAHA